MTNILIAAALTLVGIVAFVTSQIMSEPSAVPLPDEPWVMECGVLATDTPMSCWAVTP